MKGEIYLVPWTVLKVWLLSILQHLLAGTFRAAGIVVIPPHSLSDELQYLPNAA